MNTAFLFPGQGSQRVGMGADLVVAYGDVVSRYYREADDVLGFSLSRLCFEGGEDDLRATEVTQPAVFLTSVVTLAVLREHGIAPDVVAGHSLGEYTALVAAGALHWTDALRLVRRRGELMAGVSTPGRMAAVIGLDAEVVERLCAEAGCEPANYNEPRQTVVSGTVEAVDRLVVSARAAGAEKAKVLDVSAPFHCSLMREVEDEFAAELSSVAVAAPELPVIGGGSATYLGSVDEVRTALREQLAGPVRWTDTLRRLAADGTGTWFEVGPGRVLSGFVRATCPDAEIHSCGDARRVRSLLGRLAAAG